MKFVSNNSFNKNFIQIKSILTSNIINMEGKNKKSQQKQSTLHQYIYKTMTRAQNNGTVDKKDQKANQDKVNAIQKEIQLLQKGFQGKQDQNLRSSVKSVKSDISAKQQMQLQMPNVEFYLNKRQSYPSGDLIDQIHKQWWGKYERLQKHHGFIQWLFPNQFKSRFNNNSYPLTDKQEKQFRTNPEIYKRYVKSYEMMLEFYGMKLKSKYTGQIVTTRHPPFQQRFYQTLLTSFHNHMRITRILCSLTMVGFGRYAKQLCAFLKKEIYSQNGGLKKLEKYNVYKDWKDYQKYEETEQDLSEYFKEKNLRNQFKKTKL